MMPAKTLRRHSPHMPPLNMISYLPDRFEAENKQLRAMNESLAGENSRLARIAVMGFAVAFIGGLLAGCLCKLVK